MQNTDKPKFEMGYDSDGKIPFFDVIVDETQIMIATKKNAWQATIQQWKLHKMTVKETLFPSSP